MKMVLCCGSLVLIINQSVILSEATQIGTYVNRKHLPDFKFAINDVDNNISLLNSKIFLIHKTVYTIICILQV